MSEKERKAVENVVRGRQPVLVPLPVRLKHRHPHTDTQPHTLIANGCSGGGERG